MTIIEAQYWLKRFTQRFFLIRLAEATVPVLGLSILIFSICKILSFEPFYAYVFTLPVFVLLVGIRLYQYKLWAITQHSVIHFLHQQHTFLQNSLDLLLPDLGQSPSTLQRIQQEKVLEALSKNKHLIKTPSELKKGNILLGLCLLCSAILLNNNASFYSSTKYLRKNTNELNKSKDSAIIGGMEISKITVSPPAYTQVNSFTSTIQNLVIPEGSLLKFDITFKNQMADPMLIISGKDSIKLEKVDDRAFQLSFKPQQDLYYQIVWQKDSLTRSDLYSIQIKRDAKPVITINNLEQFTELSLNDHLIINLESNIKDDYQIRDAHIVATVSKGSGESVKFREEKIGFTSPTQFFVKELRAKTTLDLVKLGLEPGDELYFYVVASDNKQEKPNINRTETYFIALQDTTRYETSADEGLGVDLMPEYFRSQRQIIIDTEKLLTNKASMKKESFRFTSNELGYDQKVLRLRYSEFMGEEFISGISPQVSGDDIESTDEMDVTKEFGHVHDTENDHNLVDNHKEDKHDHEHEHENKIDTDKPESPLEAFIHSHDEEEEATFYIQSVKAKLRAALTLMWDAELQLRLFEPAKSLPYQYKILKLLKEISNDSRIYVHKTGFDPPPIKEDKRYSADLSDIKNTQSSVQSAVSDNFIEIQKALQKLQNINPNTKKLSTEEVNLFREAGRKIASLSIHEPLKYLECIRLLALLVENDFQKQDLHTLARKTEKELWRILPDNVAKANQESITPNKLDKLLIQELDQLQDND